MSIPTADEFAQAFRARGWTEEGIAFLADRRTDPMLLRAYGRFTGTRIGRKYIYPRKPPNKQPIPDGLRTRVFERDAYRCVRCGDWHKLHCDHIVPESRGGPTTFDNLQTLCRKCNLKKGARHDG